jgi:hypothetical protein
MESEARRDAAMAGRFASRSVVPSFVSPTITTGAKKAGAKVAKSFSDGFAPIIDPLTNKLLNPMKRPSERARYLEVRAMEREEERLQSKLYKAKKAEKERLQQRASALEGFAEQIKDIYSGIKNSLMGAFDLTNFGDTTEGILKSIKDLIAKTRTFASNIGQLSKLGLNATLLGQVVSAGPLAGGAVAEALVQGGVEALKEINVGYSEFGGLASQIATTQAIAQSSSPAQQTVFNINVNGGVGSGPSIGAAIVEAIKSYERTSGKVWAAA